MSLLLKNLSVVDQGSEFKNTKVDIFIQNGIIESFQSKTADDIIDLDGFLVTPGWFDLDSHFNDPGFEFKEDIISGSRCASLSGFTDVCLVPSTNPVVETKADVAYLTTGSSGAVDLHAIGALSEANEGKNLTEILDLHAAGAVGFSSGDLPIWNSELLIKALQYTAPISVPIIQNARDIHLSKNTHMHEGLESTRLGMRAEPALSEEVTIRRDLELLKFSGGSLHFSKLSTAGAVELIRSAKASGLKVSCDVSIHHLLFTDKDIGNFDSNYKNSPPYRLRSDRMALLNGILDGTIDAIVSNHRPQDSESKDLEFDLADPGSISLQTFYSSLLKLTEDVPFELLVEKITNGPRRVLGMEDLHIVEGAPAKLTVLSPEESWVLNSETNLSKSTNSPFWGQKLIGKVLGTVNGENYLNLK
ncbi:MAG: dihydroorotase [Ekhidna sp.]|nr:dihydroorotase [Ekhidna sp.]